MAGPFRLLCSNLLMSLFHIRRPGVPVHVALSNVIAIIVPLGIGLLYGHVLTGLSIALGAFIVMSADEPGPYPRRLALIAMASLAGALSAFAGHLIDGQSWLLLLALAVWGFASGISVVFGPRATRVSMISMILLVVSTATPLSWQAALESGALILAGGGLQALFSVMAWPWHRFRPEQQEMAGVYRDLASLARRDIEFDQLPPIADTLAHMHRSLASRSATRNHTVGGFYVLLTLADRIRLELVALDEYPTDPVRLDIYRHAVAEVLEGIATAFAQPGTTAGVESSVAALQTLDFGQWHGPKEGGIFLHKQTLESLLAAAVRRVNRREERVRPPVPVADPLSPGPLKRAAPWVLLRANCRFSSVAFRHALRMALLLLLAGFVSRHIGLAHGYWLPMTCAIVLRPEFGTTFTIGLQRMVGTFLGLLLTTAILVTFSQSPWVHLVLMGLLCFGFRYLANVNYAAAVASLTGSVVIMLSFHGVASGPAVIERLAYTIMGSSLTLGVYLLWPTWERGYTFQTLATMLERYADYLGGLSAGGTDYTRLAYRSAARVARGNAMTSLERLRDEPASHAGQAEKATVLFAAANRLVRTAMLLEALMDDDDKLPCPDETNAFIEVVVQRQRILAKALRSACPPPACIPALLEQQQLFEARLRKTPDSGARAELIMISARLVENIDTLAHLLEGQAEQPQADLPGVQVESPAVKRG